VAAYRAAKMREKHAAEGSPLPPNHYDTTGWAKPMHPVYMYIYIYTYIHIYIYIYIEIKDDSYTEFTGGFSTVSIVRKYLNGDGAWNVSTATGIP